MNEFFTIEAPSEGLFKEKGSKFLAYAYPVESEADVKNRLEELRKQYYDARHHCYAYIIGLKKQAYRANDDGEPNHSAGDPILGQIRSMNLTNCLVVVVRYFGGTKLGVGGLIAAYKTAAEEALKQAKIRTIYSQTTFDLTFSYEATAEVERALAGFDIHYLEKNYTDSCQFVGLLKDEDVPLLEAKLELTEGVRLTFAAD
ncbi:IMPACT family protein [Marinoscillum furvescens]|uniref:Putative YigZ family protein n=1 Tax=Marinoscillum furvescens DSM 4134 TaxID=1122208 RepID=A0A3D9L4T9_MARFU|nr:YigZ family protein [Marinoscillum furvescens]REE01033.1 putative YigZ family protein [Marinoscillum furvescens DSM 4134]